MNDQMKHGFRLRQNPNRGVPLGIFALILASSMFLTISGCTGLTGAGTVAAKSSSTSAASGTLAASPTTLNFGNVAAGSSSPQTLTLSNTGTAAVTVSQATITGAGFSVAAGMPSVSIAAGQSHDFQVQFAPAGAGRISGGITIVSDATDATLAIPLSGTGMTTLAIASEPRSESVVVGQSATFSVVATGTGTLTYQWKKGVTAISGATAASYTTPATVSSDNGALFTVVVTDSTGSLASNVAMLTVNTTPSKLNASATSLAFSSINIGSDKILPVVFTNVGNSSVTISTVMISGAGYTASGIQSGQIVTPGRTATLNVTFSPAGTGLIQGNVTVTSDAANPSSSITLSGTGLQAASHSVTLTWTASASSVSGYDVYRSPVSGGPYTMLNSTLDATTTYMDTAVQAAQTYYYVAASVDSSGVEGAYSSEVSATIP